MRTGIAPRRQPPRRGFRKLRVAEAPPREIPLPLVFAGRVVGVRDVEMRARIETIGTT
jgi:hypothetical protein